MGLRGTFDIKNPMYSYASGEMNSNVIANRRSSDAKVVFFTREGPKEVKVISNIEMSMSIMDGDITFMCPFTQPIRVEYRHNTDFTDFNNHALISYQENRKVTADLEFGSQGRYHGLLKLKTPYRGTENVQLGFVHRGNELRDFLTTAHYSANDKRIEFLSSVDIINKLKFNFTISSPFRGIRVAKVDFLKEGPKTNHRMNMEAVYNDYAFKSRTNLGKTDEEGFFTTELETPFRPVHALEVTARIEGRPDNFRMSTHMQRNSDNIDTLMNWSKTARITSITSELKSNLFEDISITVGKEGIDMTNMRAQAMGMVSDKKVETVARWSTSNLKSEGSLVIKRMNIPELKNLEISIENEGELPSLVNRMNVRYGRKILTTESRVNHGNNDVSIITIVNGDLPEMIFEFESSPMPLTVTFNSTGK